jgi:hypothetical protein
VLERVLGGRVELLVDRADDAVLLAADDADLDLEDDVRGRRTGEQLLAICRFSSSGTAEPSHMCDWNSGPPARDPLARVEQRPDEAVELVLRAVVGVQTRHGTRIASLATSVAVTDRETPPSRSTMYSSPPAPGEVTHASPPVGDLVRIP